MNIPIKSASRSNDVKILRYYSKVVASMVIRCELLELALLLFDICVFEGAFTFG